MQFTLYGKNINISDDVADRYAYFIDGLTQDELEYLGETCRFTDDTPVQEMEQTLTGAMEEILAIHAATPAIIREAERRGILK